MTQTQLKYYRKIRTPMYGAFHTWEESATNALRAAKIIARFRELESEDLVRIRVEFDDDADVSLMSDKEREEWNGEAFGTISEFRLSDDDEWEHADSCWGHIGYRDYSDPFENPYVVDEMASAIEQYDALVQDSQDVRAEQESNYLRGLGV